MTDSGRSYIIVNIPDTPVSVSFVCAVLEQWLIPAVDRAVPESPVKFNELYAIRRQSAQAADVDCAYDAIASGHGIPRACCG